MRLSFRFLPIIILLGTSVQAGCAEQFKDVPKDHWAAEYVARAASNGVMKGYPDSTFKGDKAVTRYELAVALERMIEVIEKGLKPEVKGAESGGQRAQSQNAPQQPQSQKTDPAQGLKESGYIADDSPLLANREKIVSSTELAQALASITAKLIEKHIPMPKE